MVAESIKEFGFKNPIIVDKDNVIIAGHTRLKAAYKLGLKEAPVIIAEDLTEDQAKAFRLVDNKTAELAEWDFKKLEEELLKINIDMEAFEFEVLNNFPSEIELDRDEIGTKNRQLQIKYGGTVIPLTEDEDALFSKVLDDFLSLNGTLYGFIDYILGGRE